MTSTGHPDRRVQRTRHAILEAFRDLVVSESYDDVRIADIVAKAGIGRSTFYEHFRGKDELLTHSITWLFEVLADASVGRADEDRLAFVLDHFYEQRRLARVLLHGRPLRLLTDRLASLIGQRASSVLIAHGAAAAQLEILGTWLGGRVRIERAAVVVALTGLADKQNEESN